MIGTKKAIETTANCAILLVCLLFCWSYLTHKSLKFSAGLEESALKGVTLPALPGYRWSERPETLVLAIRTGCHYCELSMPFYRRLSELQKTNGLRARMLAVMPDDQEIGSSLLRSSGLDVDGVFNQKLDALNVSGTPTLMLLDSHGRVEHAWVGQLPPRGEDEVIKAAKR